jgi:hypothetical protein
MSQEFPKVPHLFNFINWYSIFWGTFSLTLVHSHKKATSAIKDHSQGLKKKNVNEWNIVEYIP